MLLVSATLTFRSPSVTLSVTTPPLVSTSLRVAGTEVTAASTPVKILLTRMTSTFAAKVSECGLTMNFFHCLLRNDSGNDVSFVLFPLFKGRSG